jgi:hypothetical protein
MGRRYLVSKILLVDGILLIVLAFVHLISTPLISKWLSRQLTEQVLRDISPPFFLNHITVGILLIPFGISTLFSAVGVRSGQWWARGIALTNALAVLFLPLLVVVIMGSRYFDAPLFLIAAIIVTVIGLSMILPLIWLWSDNNMEEHHTLHRPQ